MQKSRFSALNVRLAMPCARVSRRAYSAYCKRRTDRGWTTHTGPPKAVYNTSHSMYENALARNRANAVMVGQQRIPGDSTFWPPTGELALSAEAVLLNDAVVGKSLVRNRLPPSLVPLLYGDKLVCDYFSVADAHVQLRAECLAQRSSSTTREHVHLSLTEDVSEFSEERYATFIVECPDWFQWETFENLVSRTQNEKHLVSKFKDCFELFATTVRSLLPHELKAENNENLALVYGPIFELTRLQAKLQELQSSYKEEYDTARRYGLEVPEAPTLPKIPDDGSYAFAKKLLAACTEKAALLDLRKICRSLWSLMSDNMVLPNHEVSPPSSEYTGAYEVLTTWHESQFSHPIEDEVDVYGIHSGPSQEAEWTLDRFQNRIRSVVSDSLGDDVFDSILKQVLKLLGSESSNDSISAELFALLGDASFDLVLELTSHRHDIVRDVQLSQRTSGPAQADSVARLMEGSLKAGTSEKKNPTIAQRFSVKTAQERELEKWRRKDERKVRNLLRKLKKDEGHAWNEQEEDVSAVFEQASLDKSIQEAAAEKQSNDLAGFVREYRGGTMASVLGSLPKGTKRLELKEYDMVSVPAPVLPPPVDVANLVSIASLEPFAQLAFPGVQHLNRIQTAVFEKAYYSNENMLICAPTGAGKTNIAALCMLREIREHIDEAQVLRKARNPEDSWKIVYVAPMKALAQEVVANFSKRLGPLGISVRELTGDQQLTRQEIIDTQVIVTTPEKFDIMSRKSGDQSLINLVRLLIIDEVHLLHEDRGPVIEAIVARTLRHVESSQGMIRIVGLSATLPNYEDVALFLRVNIRSGLFFFDSRYRPVPLEQYFIGVKDRKNPILRMQMMNDLCYERMIASIREGHQVMVFVHARKETINTARALFEKLAADTKATALREDVFNPTNHEKWTWAQNEVNKSRHNELKSLILQGFGAHHAGLIRSDRGLVEKLFANGVIRVLVCTATLAWGVNLPAHTVIIKGTEVYNQEKGSFQQLGMLDVMQIFGRAGRPQFDTSGEGIILTTHDQLPNYLRMLTHTLPIESQMVKHLADNLNAEVVLGTVSNLREAVQWLSYTYLYIRMMKNPMAYGIPYEEKFADHSLERHRRRLVSDTLDRLEEARMTRFDRHGSNTLGTTENGRIASHYYITHETMGMLAEKLRHTLSEAGLFNIFSNSSEFQQIQLRDDEIPELERLKRKSCPLDLPGSGTGDGGVDGTAAKVNILLQSYISGAFLESFSLVGDSNYIIQSASRLVRGLFELTLKKSWTLASSRLLTIGKMLEHRQWGFHSPLRQLIMMEAGPGMHNRRSDFTPDMINKLERRPLPLHRIEDLSASEIADFYFSPKMGKCLKRIYSYFPKVSVEYHVQPITRTVLRVELTIIPEFLWSDRYHPMSGNEPWWVIVDDQNGEYIYHSEYLSMPKKTVIEKQRMTVCFTVPLTEPMPPQYFIRVVSDRWMGAETEIPLSLSEMILPERYPPPTQLLPLQPLPVSVLKDDGFERMFAGRYTHFNPIQTQVFHTVYHTDRPVLLCAPTGSGKTVAAELAVMRMKKHFPNKKCVYIAPLKALVRERMKDWRAKFQDGLGMRILELTGDYTPDLAAIKAADILCTTPEKWDGISRNWQARSYVKSVYLMVFDEIHLLGSDRGAILEVIVSRMRYIASQTDGVVRLLGLSTALSNARDVADWMGISTSHSGLYNFRPSVRPVPMEVHIQGHPGRHYCPRMNSMNRPAYQAMKQHGDKRPVLIFVSSRRQTRLTALDLITAVQSDPDERAVSAAFWGKDVSTAPWLKEDIDVSGIHDSTLQHVLHYGVGIHHAGLSDGDRVAVENWFVEGRIQILVATSTLAWGVNTPTHLVIIKGTEYFDGKQQRYVDMPITDILQMMGRAGRPQYDNTGVAVLLVHDVKKAFYKKFLYEPFPVESSLHLFLHDHVNAEIAAGTITSRQDCIDYLTWTFYYRRLLQNPSYYDLQDVSDDAVSGHLSVLVGTVLDDLEGSRCITTQDDDELESTPLGEIASYYYISYKTVELFSSRFFAAASIDSSMDALKLLSDAHEYDEFPVRHNEDKINANLAKCVPLPVDAQTFDSPHTKAYLLLQTHMEGPTRVKLPSTDYGTDRKSVLDQALRIAQAMIDVAAEIGVLHLVLQCCELGQSIIRGQWARTSSLWMLPLFDDRMDASGTVQTRFRETLESRHRVRSIAQLIPMTAERQRSLLLQASGKAKTAAAHVDKSLKILQQLPDIDVRTSVSLVTPAAADAHDDDGTAKDADFWEEETAPAATSATTSGASSGVLSVSNGDTVEVTVQLRDRRRFSRQASKQAMAYAPRYPKPKSEGWMVLVADRTYDTLYALKRISIPAGGTARCVLRFDVDTTATGSVGVGDDYAHRFAVYVMSDSYIGLDQEYDLEMTVRES